MGGEAASERARARALAVRVNTRLATFPSTIEADEELLARDPAARLRAALGYRLERKRLLRSARDALLMYADACLAPQ